MEGFKDLSPDAKVRYRKMIEQHNAEEANKKKNKKKNKLQEFAEKLYGGSK
tara:strand:- start:502 stop:654 length:153 start_codon:yes stop_codon:yes gene_type:complete